MAYLGINIQIYIDIARKGPELEPPMTRSCEFSFLTLQYQQT